MDKKINWILNTIVSLELTVWEADKPRDRQVQRQTGRDTDRQADRQSER